MTSLISTTSAASCLHLVDHIPAIAGPPARAGADPEELLHAVALLESELGRTAIKDMLPMQPGDVTETFADVGGLMRDMRLRPETSIEDGIREFFVWYRGHYKL